MSSSITVGANTYNLVTVPSYPGISQIDFTMEDTVTLLSSPFNPAVVQTQSWPGADMWVMSFTLPKMTRLTAAPWRGFMAELRGQQNVFQFGDPYCLTPVGAALGAPVTAGTNSVMATQLVTAGWSPSTYGQLLSGDYLQIGYRLYQVCENVNSASDGSATIQIWPSLRDTITTSTPLRLISTQGLFRLAQNQRSWHADYTGLMQISFKCVEVR
jgi:hypothetical protein